MDEGNEGSGKGPALSGQERISSESNKTAAKETTSRIFQDAVARGKKLFTDQKNKTSGVMEDLAGVLQDSARQLQNKEHPSTARFLQRSAEKISRLSSSLRERDVETLFFEMRNYANRRPAIWFTGAVVGGFFLTRLLKSAAAANRKETAPPVVGPHGTFH